jgi:hypothetical protein
MVSLNQILMVISFETILKLLVLPDWDVLKTIIKTTIMQSIQQSFIFELNWFGFFPDLKIWNT